MAYSMELRERVVAAYHANPKWGYRRVGEVFSIGEATVNRWVQRAKRGKLEADAIGGSVGAFDAAELAFIEALLVERPDRTLREVQAAFRAEYERYHPLSTIHRAIRKKLGFPKIGPRWSRPSGFAKM